MDDPKLPNPGVDTNGWAYIIEAMALLSANMTADIGLVIENFTYLKENGYATSQEVDWLLAGARHLLTLGEEMTDAASIDAGDKQAYIDIARIVGPVPLLFTILHELTRSV